MLNMNDVIAKKRDGGVLTTEEIQYFVKGYTEGSIPDYQASALLMAIYIRGLTKPETFDLTAAMRDSGELIDLSKINGVKVDKHSTGGVGDKVSLIVAPIVASQGVPIAKMSGRGLGFTGGTVDKMESIPGFNVALEPDEFFAQVNKIGMAIIGQTAHVAPADKKIYALRDVTATVGNFGLIASSIMSKKLAAGADAIVLDVKCGDGAFMEDIEDATTLAKLMVEIGENAGKKTVAMITEMGQPLGSAVGNALEIIEVIDVLKGKGPSDITELTNSIAGMMLYLGGKAKNHEDGIKIAKAAIESGTALAKLREFIAAQGGDNRCIDDYNILPTAKLTREIRAEKSGCVEKVAARAIGVASQALGAGRATKEEAIDYSAGIRVLKKVGDSVEKGDVLAVLYSNSESKMEDGFARAKAAFTIGEDKVEKPLLIKKIVGGVNDLH